VVPALLNALADADPGIHAKARDSLTRLRLDSKKDLGALKEGIKHKDVAIRLFAMKVLVQGVVNPDIASILIDATKDSHAKVRKLAVAGLAKSDLEAKEMAQPALMDALKDKNKNIRQAALESLDKFGKPREPEIPRLIKCLQNDTVEVRLYAMQTLVKFDGETTKRAVYAFAEMLKDEEKRVAQLAAEAIGNIGLDAKSFAPQLQQVVLKDTDKELRRQAMGALAKIGRANGSVEAVISALDDRELRKTALDCLTKMGPLDETDIPALGSMLKSNHPEVRSRAVVELGKQGNKAVKLVAPVLKDKDTAVRLLAAAALGGIKGKEAALALTEALPKEEE